MSIVENVRILPGYKTDHFIIEIELIINDFQRGKGFWHVNNSHMKNKDYVSNVKKIIQETLLEYSNPNFNDITNSTLKILDDLFLDTLLT